MATQGLDCSQVTFSRHAIQRMFERDIKPTHVEETLRSGVQVEDYPDDHPFPSRLLLGWSEDSPLHVVAGQDSTTGRCVVITVYLPSSKYWEPDWIRRKRS